MVLIVPETGFLLSPLGRSSTPLLFKTKKPCKKIHGFLCARDWIPVKSPWEKQHTISL